MEQNSPRASDYLPANFLAGLERGDAMQLRRETEMLSPNSVIVEVLWGAVQDYREGGDSPGVREEFRRLTAKSVHDIDEKILGSMLR